MHRIFNLKISPTQAENNAEKSLVREEIKMKVGLGGASEARAATKIPYKGIGSFSRAANGRHRATVKSREKRAASAQGQSGWSSTTEEEEKASLSGGKSDSAPAYAPVGGGRSCACEEDEGEGETSWCAWDL